ncbi:acyl-CoA thioesterase-1 [Mucilaginibacter oryzae]|uniref:Acyl-CoA thioesterase-1 n=1 Tax=Mucilaginibacter oryzae TaxID=468058 RepID=A0A316H908_9SPHI|nr:arylesterase [Mucilaginibacter oryzae]PWK77639.1 acyl-CoA thioesterase-1 [Mucilaginibacter oryzae]
MHNILFFGDSLTAGYGLKDAKNQSLPALIQQKLRDEGLAYHVINGGVSGDTTSGGFYRLDYWINRPVSIFVLELGINDLIRGMSPQNTADNLQAIIDRVRQKHPQVKIALMGMEIPDFIPGTFANRFKAIFREIAEANDLAFLPFYLQGVAGIAHLNLPDRLHPNAEGYKVMAEHVWPVIKKLLPV